MSFLDLASVCPSVCMPACLPACLSVCLESTLNDLNVPFTPISTHSFYNCLYAHINGQVGKRLSRVYLIKKCVQVVFLGDKGIVETTLHALQRDYDNTNIKIDFTENATAVVTLCVRVDKLTPVQEIQEEY